MTTSPLARARGWWTRPQRNRVRVGAQHSLSQRKAINSSCSSGGGWAPTAAVKPLPLGDRSRRVTVDTRGLLSDAARGGQLGRRPAARAPLLVGPHESEGFHSLIGDTNPRYQTQQQTGLRAHRLQHQTLQPRTPRVLLGRGGGRCPRSLGTASGKDQQALWVRQCGPSLQKLSAATWVKAPR